MDRLQRPRAGVSRRESRHSGVCSLLPARGTSRLLHVLRPGIRVNRARMNELAKTMLRVALVALGLLMVPAVASRLVAGWNWPAGAFVRLYALFFVTGLVYALVARRMGAWSYKLGVGVALAAAFAFGWSTMVQTADSGHPERLWYLSVLVVGIVGALLARLKP